jgi:hypothetical protein
MSAALILALVILVPVHGAFWYGIRQERLKQRMLFRIATQRRR